VDDNPGAMTNIYHQTFFNQCLHGRRLHHTTQSVRRRRALTWYGPRVLTHRAYGRMPCVFSSSLCNYHSELSSLCVRWYKFDSIKRRCIPPPRKSCVRKVVCIYARTGARSRTWPFTCVQCTFVPRRSTAARSLRRVVTRAVLGLSLTPYPQDP
jgi:hypothetical protein